MARTEDLAKKERSDHSSSSSSEDAAATEIDHISCLPDHLLSTILYFLPTQIAARTAARTALLSPRWRCIWTDHPLRLDGNSISSLSLRPHGRPGHTTKGMHGKDWRSCLITDILTSHPGPVEQFRLAHTHSGSREPLRDSWFQILAYRIELEFPSFHRRQDLPASLLTCETLRSLSLSNCRLPDTAAAPFNFLHLTELSLCCMDLTEDDYCSILSGCPALVRLSLIQNSPVPRIRIRSHYLLMLTVGGNWIGELRIEHAEKLTQLIFKDCSEMSTSLKIMNAPMIKTVESSSDYPGVQDHS